MSGDSSETAVPQESIVDVTAEVGVEENLTAVLAEDSTDEPGTGGDSGQSPVENAGEETSGGRRCR